MLEERKDVSHSSRAMTNGSVPPPSEHKILEKPIHKNAKNVDLLNIQRIIVEDGWNDSSYE